MKMLLHTCCAPCASGAIERLDGLYEPTLFFYNPCIYPESESKIRYENVVKLCSILDLEYIAPETAYSQYKAAISGMEACSEGGERCVVCIGQRLDETARAAAERGFDCFATTLTVSPKKNAETVNRLGAEAAKKYGIQYIATDFKKRDGYLTSIRRSKEYGLYRQGYCGCEYTIK